MSPLFGGRHDEDRGDDVTAMEAEIARVEGLPLERFAAEVMARTFGDDGPGGRGKPGTLEDLTSTTFARLGITDIARALTPAWAGHGVGPDLQRRYGYLVSEALQALENGALVRVSWQGGQAHYMATRRGRSAVDQGTVERVLGGGTAT